MTWYVDTDYPVAYDSIDHLFPVGTKDDNYKSGNFNVKLRQLLGKHIVILDLGCAGGGFVESLLEEGHEAVGLEGSDYSFLRQRAAWATIPNNLFTCDISKPFTVHQGSHRPYPFDVVTLWEVIEHIEVFDLPQLLTNISRHLRDGGLIILTTPYYASDSPPKSPVDHHRSRKPPQWWDETITQAGFERQPEIESHFGRYWLRDGKVRRVFMKYKDS